MRESSTRPSGGAYIRRASISLSKPGRVGVLRNQSDMRHTLLLDPTPCKQGTFDKFFSEQTIADQDHRPHVIAVIRQGFVQLWGVLSGF